MDDFPVEKSPRRELQGPRPAPLKVRKDSYKIRKPPVAPQQPSQPPPPVVDHPRPPVIIYTVSPKVIHTSASDFMTLVQRLTGSSSTSSISSFSSSSSSSSAVSSFSTSSMSSSSSGGALSPAARMATIEKAKSYEGERGASSSTTAISPDIMDQLLGIDAANIDKMSSFPGILSPVPSSLPPISPNFFSPSLETNPLSFLHHELSPIFQGNKNYTDGYSFMTSPTTAFLSTPIPSPTPSFDLFNQFFD